MKRIINRSITVLFALIFLYATGHLLWIGYDSYQNKQTLLDAKELYSQPREARQSEAEVVGENPFDSLHAVNEHIVGWLSIAGTAIEYPVMRADDNDYYLNRNYKDERNRAGSIFMDYRNRSIEESQHTILYGHHMRDGTMFHDLEQFADETFFSQTNDHFFDIEESQYNIEIFSAYYTTTDFYYIETDFANDKAYGSFLEDIKERSIHSSSIEVTNNDRIITFSTCDDGAGQDGRFVVHGKLVEVNS
ncbi:class B sortase [Shouchella sp. 1P09AA]|uniref:class B sortase n=1 Tax=unclassified Shouchella TaxID=2893065 RepID=UPI0039A13DB9